MNTGIAVNPTATTIAVVLVYGDASPLVSAVSRAMEVAGTVNPAFLYYALFVQTLPDSPKQASERIFLSAAIAQLLLLISVANESDDYQIPEDIVS